MSKTLRDLKFKDCKRQCIEDIILAMDDCKSFKELENVAGNLTDGEIDEDKIYPEVQIYCVPLGGKKGIDLKFHPEMWKALVKNFGVK